MSQSTITKNIQNIISAITGLLLLLTATAITAETQTASQSSSISYASSDAENIDVITQLKLAKPEHSTAFVKQGYRSETASIEKYQTEVSYSSQFDFSIYSVTTELLSDQDYDGFYHHFSITIDADTVFNNAYVYARFYLSYEGGPWNYNASSSAYNIYNDSSQDSFVINTVLDSGYAAGYYDVRIELYDAYTDQWLLSYGPYDSYAISGLPLEDAYYDDGFIETGYAGGNDVLIVGGGSINGIVLLMVAFITIVIRRTGTNSTLKNINVR